MNIVYKDSSKKITNCKPCGVEVIHESVGGLLAVINFVMSGEVSIRNTPFVMERYIKIFMSTIDRIDQSIKIDNLGSKDPTNIKEHAPYWLLK